MKNDLLNVVISVADLNKLCPDQVEEFVESNGAGADSFYCLKVPTQLAFNKDGKFELLDFSKQ
jgi:hypothetical protein